MTQWTTERNLQFELFIRFVVITQLYFEINRRKDNQFNYPPTTVAWDLDQFLWLSACPDLSNMSLISCTALNSLFQQMQWMQQMHQHLQQQQKQHKHERTFYQRLPAINFHISIVHQYSRKIFVKTIKFIIFH